MQTRTYQLATISERAIALIIDTLIISAIGGAIGFTGGHSLFGGGFMGFMLGAGYQWYFLTHQNGQTLGKMVMNIQVVKTDGTPIHGVEAIVRYIGYSINSGILMLGWVWTMVDRDRQGWHDKIASTFVVKVPSN